MEYLMAIGGLVLLVFSGKYLVVGGVQLSTYLRLSPLVIGMTVIAFGTSAPELIVSVQAVFQGLPDIAVGNVVGSNIANIALVLAITAMILPIPVKSKTLLKDWLVMMIASVLLVLFVFDDTLANWEGIILIVILILYIIHSMRSYQSKIDPDSIPEHPMKLWLVLLIIGLSSLGLAFGSDILVKGASQIASNFGISEKIISISLIAFGTSVPELATSVIAAMKKQTDISIGNIIGSNIFNILAVLGISSSLKKIYIVDFFKVYMFDFLVMIFLSAFLILLLIPLKNGLLTRWKGLLLFVLYCTYMYSLIQGFSFSNLF